MKHFIPLLLVTIALAGCSGKLSRGKALELLQQKNLSSLQGIYYFPKSFTTMHVVGSPETGGDAPPSSATVTVYKLPWALENTVTNSEQKGLITIRHTVERKMWGGMEVVDSVLSFELTPEGRKYSLGDDANTYRIKLCDVHAGQIVRMYEADPSRTEVEYMLENINVSPFVYTITNATLPKNEKLQAEFIKYDNGWQLNR